MELLNNNNNNNPICNAPGASVTDPEDFRKLYFSRSVSSAIFACRSKLMAGSDSMGPDLQLVGARFSNSF